MSCERAFGWWLIAGLLVGCGVSDRKVPTASGGGGAGAAGESAGGGDANGGTANGGGDANGGSANSGNGDLAGAGDEAGASGCVSGTLRCADNRTPSKCVDGVWLDQPACEAATPACSNGVCAFATLSGGLSVVDGALSNRKIYLVEHGLELAPPVCGTISSQKICVTGGIRP
jgi:hypothetical protein